jgi:hypothetical protein
LCSVARFQADPIRRALPDTFPGVAGEGGRCAKIGGAGSPSPRHEGRVPTQSAGGVGCAASRPSRPTPSVGRCPTPSPAWPGKEGVAVVVEAQIPPLGTRGGCRRSRREGSVVQRRALPGRPYPSGVARHLPRRGRGRRGGGQRKRPGFRRAFPHQPARGDYHLRSRRMPKFKSSLSSEEKTLGLAFPGALMNVRST